MPLLICLCCFLFNGFLRPTRLNLLYRGLSVYNTNMNEILEQKIRDLPRAPGVYIMMDKEGTIIYIGKAKVLKNRVSQYFFNLASHSVKVSAMVSNIADFRYIITNSELDALSLEATLVKRHQPHYNILLKDDKAHPYIRIDLKQKYPALEITRRLKADGAKYFGPYFGGVNVRDVIEICKSAFKVRACHGNKWASGHRVCLNYHIGLCSGACEGRISEEEYHQQLVRAIRFLHGDDSEIGALLTAGMKAAAATQNFEQAMVYRDRLAMLQRLSVRLLANLSKDADFDVFGFAFNELRGAANVQIIRGGKIIAAENFAIQNSGLSQEESTAEFMTRYYDGSRMLPPEAVVVVDGEAMETLRAYLESKYGRKFCLTKPKQGAKKKLAENAATNARDFLIKSVDRVRRREEMTVEAVRLLQQILGLSQPPRRMECYDISHISGTDKVASMVVFFDGEPDKKSYRRFRIKTVEGSDDFACMKEVLLRRLARLDEADAERFGARPDLIVIDGGKGQLSYSEEAMKESGHIVPIVSLAKQFEEVYMPERSQPIVLGHDHNALKLLQRIRDEAHRFAITYHRTLREHRYRSQLEDVPGLGKARIDALLSVFKTPKAVAEATAEQLTKVEGIGLKRAQEIVRFFEKQNKDKTQQTEDQVDE